MAKAPPPRPGSSKIRFIMLEADLKEGDISEITQAISNALRQAPVSQRLIASDPGSFGNSAISTNGTAADADSPNVDAVRNEEDQHDDPPSPRPTRVQQFRTPKVLADVDLKSGDTPFKAFADSKGPPEETLRRYLLVAYWFKRYRLLDSITPDHAYTCYKHMGWGTSIKDFSQAFRDLKRAGKGDVKAGAFVVNHIGEDQVEQMKTS